MRTKILRRWKLGEPDSHMMMRHAKTILRILLAIMVLSTISLLIFYRPAAYLAAVPVPILFLGYLFACYLERQSRAMLLRVPNQTLISADEVEMNAEYAGIYTAMGLVLLFAISSFIVVATMVEDWGTVGLSASVLFLLALFIVLPYLPIFIAEAAQDERDKLEREAESDREEDAKLN
ncbi:MAG: hypothetical protein ACK5PB_08450 [Pirellula sp.]|jgi:hypothetical protein